MRRFFRVTYYFGCILLFVFVAVIGFTQTRSFKTYLRSILILQSKTVINGQLQLGIIQGNLLTGFSIRDVSVGEFGTEIISADRIEIKYDPFGLLFKRFGISNAVIVNPHIHLFRSMDGTWNVTSLFKPRPTDTLPSAWSIDIKRIELTNAEVIFTDSLRLFRRQLENYKRPSDNVVDYAQVHLREFSLVASLQIKNENYSAKIRKLQFTSLTPTFSLTQLSGDFLMTSNEVSAKGVSIETPSSRLKFDVGMKNIDLTQISDLTELETKPINLNLTADAINMQELKQFLYPWVDFLNRQLILQVKVSGVFGNMNIEKIAVQTPYSLVQLQGKLLNLHRPHDLEMNLYSNENTISTRDLIDYLPGLKIPDLTFLGSVDYSLKYEGKPLDFKASFQGNTAAGEFDLDGSMKIDRGNITYNAIIATRSLALGTILRDETITSNLNLKVKVDGSGMNPLTMTGLARVDVDSSSINGLTIDKSVLVFDIADGTLRSHVAASVGSGNYEISNQIKFFEKDSILYNVNSRVKSVDLAEILRDKQYESDLSFTLTAAGAIGSSVRSDTAELRFLRSAFGTENFESGEAKVIVNVHDSTNTVLHITSTVADLDVTGNFTFASLINSWQHSVQLVKDVVKYRIQNLDSLRSFTGQGHKLQEFQSSHIANFSPIDAQFRIDVDNLKPFGVFLQIPLKGKGLIEVGMIGDVTDLQFNGTLNFEQVGLRLGTDTLSADAVSIKYFLGGVNSQTALHTLNTSVETDLQNSKFNDLLLNQASAQFVLESDSSDFQFSALVDSTVRIDLEGISRQNGNLLELELPEMKVEAGQYIAENVDTVQLTLGRDGFRIQSFIMNHDAEEISLEGYFSPIGVSDLNISLKGFLLTNLKQILHRGAYAKSSTQFGGIVNMTAFYRGSFDHPNISIDLLADGVRADDSLQNKHKVLGRIESRISYFEHMLSLLVKFLSHHEDKSARPDLLLSGTLPFEFVLAYEKPHKLEGEVNLTMQSTGLSLEFLNPFIPEFHNLTGMMICDMQMKGPLDAPRYEGSMSILNSNFVFDPLGIRYSLNGDLITAGDKICLKDIIICNIPSERKVGTMRVSGNFSMSGLTLKEFDLLSHGDLFVMREDTSRARGQKIYGNLFVATGPDGLSWQGNLSASTVRGNVFIKDAQLILPPERESELMRASVVDMSFIDDTSKQVAIKSKLNNGSEKTLLSQISTNTLSTEANSGITSKLPQNSFLDRINYDIGIETQGSTQLRFVFNTQTSEELFADLQGRLYFNRTPNISRLTGQVEVSGQSYYNFIKKFEATGKLSFTGNVLNPELEVTAKYEGTHRTLASPIDSTKSLTSGTNPTELSKNEQVSVTLKITGTRNEPKTKISLATKTSQEEDWKKWEEGGKGDEEANAISYIISGQFRDELTDQQRMGLIGTNLGFALASSMLKGPLSDAARKYTYGVVQSVDMLYYGGQFSQAADLRVTGQFGEAVIRAGGRILNDLANTNVSVELPMSSILNSERFRNLIITLERRVEGINNVEEQRRASNGARLFYRITF